MINIGYVPCVEASAVSKEKTESAMNQTKQILNTRHHIEDRYYAYSLQQYLEQIDTVMTIWQLNIGSIAAISLLVGGIGIRKALGARYKDIMVQFLIAFAFSTSIGLFFGLYLVRKAATMSSMVDNSIGIW